jgi:flagellar hook assembly protein FlgD
VQINIYNIKGQKVRELVNGVYPPGEHKVVWNGKDDNGLAVGSGIYFYRMIAGEYAETRKMLLLK